MFLFIQTIWVKSIDFYKISIFGGINNFNVGYVSWGEYPMNFAAVLNQEEIYRCEEKINHATANNYEIKWLI